jgi:hypothetical protein
MKKNIGSGDRIIRLLIATVLVVLYFTGTMTASLGVIGLVLAAVLMLTILVSFCPLYLLFGIKTCKVKTT